MPIKIGFLMSKKRTLVPVFQLTVFAILLALIFKSSNPIQSVDLINFSIFTLMWCALSAIMQRGWIPNQWWVHIIALIGTIIWSLVISRYI